MGIRQPTTLIRLPLDHHCTESMFFRDTKGTIYHTYSSYARAGEELAGTYRFLDLAPLGRNEGPDGNMMKWMRRHDEYGT